MSTTMTDRGRGPAVPAHIVVMLSASTAAYAVLLAGMAGLQSTSNSAIAAAREPLAASVGVVAAGHDRLAASLDAARARYGAVADAYGSVGGRLGNLEATLSAFAASVAELDGQARSLPSSFKVPSLKSPARVSVPKTQGTSGASGG
jgi:hypothetical protein